MVSFAWSSAPALEGRFERGIEDLPLDVQERSRGEWEELLRGLGRSETEGQAWNAFDGFLSRTESLKSASKNPRVFVSHRQDAPLRGERIAEIAAARGLDYWLDIHDPKIHTAQLFQHALGPLRYAIVVAAIVEMALINCTHVVVAHTLVTGNKIPWVPSQWIPYEFGRAKARGIVTAQAAGWFQQPIAPVYRGEYVLLAHQLHTDQDVVDWFAHLRLPGDPRKATTFHGKSPVLSLDKAHP